jgi:hypothetical protein
MLPQNQNHLFEIYECWSVKCWQTPCEAGLLVTSAVPARTHSCASISFLSIVFQHCATYSTFFGGWRGLCTLRLPHTPTQSSVSVSTRGSTHPELDAYLFTCQFAERVTLPMQRSGSRLNRGSHVHSRQTSRVCQEPLEPGPPILWDTLVDTRMGPTCSVRPCLAKGIPDADLAHARVVLPSVQLCNPIGSLV